jgi:hypothetical protein
LKAAEIFKMMGNRPLAIQTLRIALKKVPETDIKYCV